MKKYLLAIILFTSSFVYAVDFSVGFTAGGWGPSFYRGDNSPADVDNVLYVSFAPALQVVGQVNFIPYFGVELGFGYGVKSVGTSVSNKRNDYFFNQLSIPLLLKGQYEIAKSVNLYIAVGPRFNFNIEAPSKIIYYDNIVEDINTSPYEFKKEEYNIFDMDFSFALGAEYKIATIHYVGLRVGYDMNLLGIFKNREVNKTTGKLTYSGRQKFYVDNLAFSLTYRYKLGR